MNGPVYLYGRKVVLGQEMSAGLLHVKKVPCDMQLLFSNFIFFGLSPLVFLIFWSVSVCSVVWAVLFW